MNFPVDQYGSSIQLYILHFTSFLFIFYFFGFHGSVGGWAIVSQSGFI